MRNKTTIVQYNCGHSNGKATRALFDSFEDPAILAIQEPGYNNYTKSTYCPKPYQLAYEARPETRVCFMIRRDVGESQWKRKQYGPNVAALTIALQEEPITIINVYNPTATGPRIQEWPRVAQALQEAQGETILLGDFNTHHTAWGGMEAECEQRAKHLLTVTRRRDLQLATPVKEPT